MPVPLATYRVQMHAGFGFERPAIADYLQDLGVTHLYASPYLQAGKGSTHGYDVLDHSKASEELGGAEAHARLCRALGEARLGQVLDIVPNHMSIASRETPGGGTCSRTASRADTPGTSTSTGTPRGEAPRHGLAADPGDHYGREVEAGESRSAATEGTFTFHYFDHVDADRPPIAQRPPQRGRPARRSDELAFLADSFGNLPISTATDVESVTRRHRDKEVLRRPSPGSAREARGRRGDRRGRSARSTTRPSEIDVLLERQNYRLAYWKTAGQELDYRRFFDINTLISMRMEDDASSTTPTA